MPLPSGFASKRPIAHGDVGRDEPEQGTVVSVTKATAGNRLTVEAKTLTNLKVEKAAGEGERRTIEADLGPVRYLATLIGAADEVVLRWFILVVAVLPDASAVLLLGATRRRP